MSDYDSDEDLTKKGQQEAVAMANTLKTNFLP
jgi:hypothetical protein